MPKKFRGNAFVDSSGNQSRFTRACQTCIIETVQTVHIMHAPAPAHQRPLLGALFCLAAAAAELALMRA